MHSFWSGGCAHSAHGQWDAGSKGSPCVPAEVKSRNPTGWTSPSSHHFHPHWASSQFHHIPLDFPELLPCIFFGGAGDQLWFPFTQRSRGEWEKWPEGSACTPTLLLYLGHHTQHKAWDSSLELQLPWDGHRLCRHPKIHSRKKGRFLHTWFISFLK